MRDDDTSTPAVSRPGTSLLGAATAVCGAVAMGASARSLHGLAQTAHGGETLVIWVLPAPGARRLATGGACPTPTPALTLAPGTASEHHSGTDPDAADGSSARAVEQLWAEVPPTDPTPEAAARPAATLARAARAPAL